MKKIKGLSFAFNNFPDMKKYLSTAGLDASWPIGIGDSNLPSSAPFPSISYHMTICLSEERQKNKTKKNILTGVCLIQIDFHLTYAYEWVEKNAL